MTNAVELLVMWSLAIYTFIREVFMQVYHSFLSRIAYLSAIKV
jgi:hypothetical protein